MTYQPHPKVTDSSYLEFDRATQELLGLDASFVLEIVRVTLADGNLFEWICDQMDISDETMSAVQEDVEGLTKGILIDDDDDIRLGDVMPEDSHRRNPDYCAKCGGECLFDDDGNFVEEDKDDLCPANDGTEPCCHSCKGCERGIS
jgi:hypothetical protein